MNVFLTRIFFSFCFAELNFGWIILQIFGTVDISMGVMNTSACCSLFHGFASGWIFIGLDHLDFRNAQFFLTVLHLLLLWELFYNFIFFKFSKKRVYYYSTEQYLTEKSCMTFPLTGLDFKIWISCGSVQTSAVITITQNCKSVWGWRPRNAV